MSEFHVVVTEIGKFAKHPNADTLSITQIHGGYPCIFRTGEFQQGEKVVYCPVDSLVPLSAERWAFLRDEKKPDAEFARIKAKKLRGIFSMGILTKAEPEWQLGQNVQRELGIQKYEAPVAPNQMMNTESEADPGFLPGYTDIEGLRKFPDVLQPGEEVVILEKIHGANGRWLYKDGRLWVGSHHQIKKEDKNNLWWKAAYEFGLVEKLAKYSDIAFYGEVFGAVQDLRYGTKPGEIRIAVFDAMDVNLREYVEFDRFVEMANDLQLYVPPILFRGPWSEDLRALSEGTTTIGGANHIREGFVVKPVKSRWDYTIGRVILKLVGEGYLLRKGA